VPVEWSQVATDIVVSKYFRKAGGASVRREGQCAHGCECQVVKGPERIVRPGGGQVGRIGLEVLGRDGRVLDTTQDAQAFEDEAFVTCSAPDGSAPNSPSGSIQGFTIAYGITGPAQDITSCDSKTGEVEERARMRYPSPGRMACFIQSVKDDM